MSIYSSRVDYYIIETHIIYLDTVVLQVSFFLTLSPDLDILRGFFDIEVRLYSSARIIVIDASRGLVTLHSEKYLHSMGDEVECETSLDDEIILFFSEVFLASIEDAVYSTSIGLGEMIELDDRYTSFECHISHESTSRIVLIFQTFCESLPESTLS